MISVTSYSLAPIQGPLQQDDLLHLLRRCLFGVGHRELAAFSGRDIGAIMDILLRQSAPGPVPVQDDPDRIDPLVPRGRPWIHAPYEDENIDKSRRDALKSWIAGLMITRDHSLTEKMTLFWHSNVVIEMDIVKDSRYSYRYASMVRSHALGNFKDLITEATTDPAMLVYLNGNSNAKGAPNENYSRELMELFTIGKGYASNYTEEDVKSAARVLTGWTDDKEKIQAAFHPERHDTADKRFSAFFDHAVIRGQQGPAGATELADLIDMIFKKEEVARFFCRKLYRYFVYHIIDDRVEAEIIGPLARIFASHDYEVAPVLRVLLSSQHFYDRVFRAAMVKSPVDFFIGSALQFDLEFPADPSQSLLAYAFFYFNMLGLLMGVGDPPSVAGWPAYYQAPKYSQWWINSYTLGLRKMLIEALVSREGLACNGPVLRFDFVRWVQQLGPVQDVDGMIAHSLRICCAADVSAQTLAKLKGRLLQSTTESEWMAAWRRILSGTADTSTKSNIDKDLRAFFKAVVNMPEYHMM